MAGKNTQKVVYEDRETLDAELNSAIADILSAEHEAARIVAQAEASVKAVQLDYANRERALRERAAAAGITVPICAGIMPVISAKQIGNSQDVAYTAYRLAFR